VVRVGSRWFALVYGSGLSLAAAESTRLEVEFLVVDEGERQRAQSPKFSWWDFKFSWSDFSSLKRFSRVVSRSVVSLFSIARRA